MTEQEKIRRIKDIGHIVKLLAADLHYMGISGPGLPNNERILGWFLEFDKVYMPLLDSLPNETI